MFRCMLGNMLLRREIPEYVNFFTIFCTTPINLKTRFYYQSRGLKKNRGQFLEST